MKARIVRWIARAKAHPPADEMVDSDETRASSPANPGGAAARVDQEAGFELSTVSQPHLPSRAQAMEFARRPRSEHPPAAVDHLRAQRMIEGSAVKVEANAPRREQIIPPGGPLVAPSTLNPMTDQRGGFGGVTQAQRFKRSPSARRQVLAHPNP